MKLIEQIEAALAAATQGEWRYDKDLSAIVHINVAKYRVEAVADFGKIDTPEANANLIALLHNHAPALVECVELLHDIATTCHRLNIELPVKAYENSVGGTTYARNRKPLLDEAWAILRKLK